MSNSEQIITSSESISSTTIFLKNYPVKIDNNQDYFNNKIVNLFTEENHTEKNKQKENKTMDERYIENQNSSFIKYLLEKSLENFHDHENISKNHIKIKVNDYDFINIYFKKDIDYFGINFTTKNKKNSKEEESLAEMIIYEKDAKLNYYNPLLRTWFIRQYKNYKHLLSDIKVEENPQLDKLREKIKELKESLV